MSKPIHIVQLYPRDMNIYGDRGNVLALTRRLERYGYTPHVTDYDVGDEWPDEVDLIVGGGGQDSGQLRTQGDLQQIGARLRALAEDDVPMLVICGMYQLFGHFFETIGGERIDGIGLLDIETYGRSERLIGNIRTRSSRFGDIIGYENHSGQTFLGADATPLADVILGAGNNLTDSHEGVVYRSVIGSYLHGSLLPKNPQLADFLIARAIQRRYGDELPAPLDDTLAERARASSFKRPR